LKRLLSITLLLVFSLPLISPLFALGTGADARLPACCRMHGKHHCMMPVEELQDGSAGSRVAALESKCPLFPKAISPAPHQTLALNQSALMFAEVLSHPALHRQTEAWARVALEGARQKRGPPSIRLS
jgi:hypothetical protein